MGGPMPSLACGYRSWTAWARTGAVEWRSTLSPSGLSMGTGSTSTSVAGTQSRSRSWPVGSRTTTIAFGPFAGRPAAATASAGVVPAGTTTRSATAAERFADTADSFVRVQDRGGAGPAPPRMLSVVFPPAGRSGAFPEGTALGRGRGRRPRAGPGCRGRAGEGVENRDGARPQAVDHVGGRYGGAVACPERLGEAAQEGHGVQRHALAGEVG